MYIGKGSLIEAIENIKPMSETVRTPAFQWINLVLGVLICFFGLKLIRVMSVMVGLSLGAVLGLVAGTALNLSGIVLVIIVVICALVLAFCSGFFYRFGALFVSFLYCASIGLLFFTGFHPGVIVFLIVSLIAAILSAIFVEPLVILLTSLAGGMRAGRYLIIIADIVKPQWAGLLAGAVFSALGLIIQFAMHSGKISKKERMRSEEIKSKESVETEVDQARSLLEEDE